MRMDDLERLAWERIDGTISMDDNEVLDGILARDPEARHRFDGLCRLADELALVETVKPPSELRPRIDRALTDSTPKWRRQAVAPRVSRKQILSVAAGLVLGVAVGRLLIPASPIDRQHATGAMTPRQERPADALDLDLGKGLGSVSVWRTGQEWTTEITLTEEHTVELVFEAETEGLDVRSIALMGSAKGEAIEESGRLVLRTAGSGTSVTTFHLAHGTPLIGLTVLRDGQVVEQQTLETGSQE